MGRGSMVHQWKRICAATKDHVDARSRRRNAAALESELERRRAPSPYVDPPTTRRDRVRENPVRHRKASSSRPATKSRTLPTDPSSSPCQLSKKVSRPDEDRDPATCL